MTLPQVVADASSGTPRLPAVDPNDQSGTTNTGIRTTSSSPASRSRTRQSASGHATTPRNDPTGPRPGTSDRLDGREEHEPTRRVPMTHGAARPSRSTSQAQRRGHSRRAVSLRKTYTGRPSGRAATCAYVSGSLGSAGILVGTVTGMVAALLAGLIPGNAVGSLVAVALGAARLRGYRDAGIEALIGSVWAIRCRRCAPDRVDRRRLDCQSGSAALRQATDSAGACVTSRHCGGGCRAWRANTLRDLQRPSRRAVGQGAVP